MTDRQDMTQLHLTADQSVQFWEDGRTLLGGSPYRVLRLSTQAAALVGGWLAGAPVAPVTAHRLLAARLVRAGIAHPVHRSARLTAQDVTLVVPVRDQPDGLAGLAAAVADTAKLLLVDDGSKLPIPGAAVRHEHSRGPAAARNSGWRKAGTELVAFLDADVTPEPGWLEPLLRHFEDPDVVAVAPRVRSTPGRSLLARYEQTRSPLDLGPVGGVVRPGSRVSYLPSAALVLRTSALRELGGFDERMRFGEDVDLIWRLAAGTGLVRYEPAAVVRHEPRPDWRAWAKQRFGYGTSAAPLALRHGRAVAPVKVSFWSAAAWAALALGRPATGVAIAAGTAALLPRKLAPFGVPARESLQLAARGHLGAGRLLGDAVTRSWWPVAVPLLAATRAGRPLLAAAFARHAVDWYRDRPLVDLPRWTAARIADDLAYGAGVWWGALRHRTVAPLLPDLSDWPGRDGVQRPAD
ncbi:mycofactocin system glycosyltransferase [Kitasatospora gansuensis]|uniref:Mycofactocin system glycosyltransferase n=1 Tax=Kitasatospora gansuensis TaxID=258050 RepID=A0A7W7S8X2_9ACTN|nr:mycofactocin biosynthesis glycosyltransferase MftF [Kitasatospora gansuensis]MBB4946099.1 mycofactocin system glycosyltransferase [Kitasatospora gansuensis]